MITRFVEQFEKHRESLLVDLTKNPPTGYDDIFHRLIKALSTDASPQFYNPDPERITCLNHGDYQGILVFIVAAEGYQPHTYWGTSVYYGSCSHCDTFEGIDGTPESNAKEYLTLMIHMLQSMVIVCGYDS